MNYDLKNGYILNSKTSINYDFVESIILGFTLYHHIMIPFMLFFLRLLIFLFKATLLNLKFRNLISFQGSYYNNNFVSIWGALDWWLKFSGALSEVRVHMNLLFQYHTPWLNFSFLLVFLSSYGSLQIPGIFSYYYWLSFPFFRMWSSQYCQTLWL